MKSKKGALGRIAEQGLWGMGTGAMTGAATGVPLLGIGVAPGAIAGGAIGLSTGLLKETIYGILGAKEDENGAPLDQRKKRAGQITFWKVYK